MLDEWKVQSYTIIPSLSYLHWYVQSSCQVKSSTMYSILAFKNHNNKIHEFVLYCGLYMAKYTKCKFISTQDKLYIFAKATFLHMCISLCILNQGVQTTNSMLINNVNRYLQHSYQSIYYYFNFFIFLNKSIAKE